MTIDGLSTISIAPEARSDRWTWLNIARTEGAERDRALVLCLILVLLLVRIAVGAVVPLAFDEAYYWRWSKNLAACYFDHPAMVAFVIRAGTLIAGDTELGVRVVSMLLALPATWAVWRSASLLFQDSKIATTAALFFNLTLIFAVGTVITTPDSPLLVASAFVLFFLAKVMDSKRGVWWLAVGAAVGTSLLSKYTALFFGVSILAWLLIVPEMRRWLLTPWPWLGGLLALAMFMPVLVWNANHDWASFAHQFGRVTAHEWTYRYLAEYFAAQFGLATPSVFVLGSMGLSAFLTGRGATRSGRVLLGAMVWPIVIYFTWHSLHQRVEGNWTAPIFPAFSIAAAAAVHEIDWTGGWKKLVDWSHKLAVPVALAAIGVIQLQSVTGLFPLGPADPTARQLGAGWRQLAAEIDSVRHETGANGIVTTSYPETGWLSFYLPSHPPVEQLTERIRWVNEPAPSPEFFKGGVLIYVRGGSLDVKALKPRYSNVEELSPVIRRRNGTEIERYSLYRLEGPTGDPLWH
jgi:4-amino-4-deoxy-L-arabinose transferase-like glycosyltransferase